MNGRSQTDAMNGNMFKKSDGMSLIEILIAVLVLSIGVLGLAALQGFSLQSNQNAYYRTQATNIAYEVADFIRADHGNAQTGASRHEAHGDRRAQQALPGGDVTIDNLDTSARQVTLTVSWVESRTDDAPEDGESVTITTRF